MFSSRSPANLVPGVHYRSSNLDKLDKRMMDIMDYEIKKGEYGQGSYDYLVNKEQGSCTVYS